MNGRPTAAAACAIVAGMLLSSVAAAEEEVPACAVHADYAKLDFWLGEWDVYVGGTPAGRNRIERVLAGCAVTEPWRGAAGGEGMSLFYVGADGAWRQVWVTTSAMRIGGTNEKTEMPGTSAGEIRFQGKIRGVDGSGHLDRTTLTRIDDDSVRQLIEVSTDAGAAWRTVFDAIYRRRVSGG